MTFKHTKFSESQVMKSFEKLAFEKGLVTAEPVVKVASQKKSSLAPTKDLMINILKLCSGLRAKGFDKVANDLENNFLNYKRADNFYETSKETGEDLVDQAHPDGSHKMEDMQGDATFETIIDQKEIIRKKVEKMPTGKLTTANDIMNEVNFAITKKSFILPAIAIIGGWIYEKTAPLVRNIDINNQKLESALENVVGETTNIKYVNKTRAILAQFLGSAQNYKNAQKGSLKQEDLSSINTLAVQAQSALNELSAQMIQEHKETSDNEDTTFNSITNVFVNTKYQEVANAARSMISAISKFSRVISVGIAKLQAETSTNTELNNESKLAQPQKDEWNQFTTLKADLENFRQMLRKENADLINSPPTKEEGLNVAKKHVAFLNALVQDYNNILSKFAKVSVAEAFNSTNYFKNVTNSDGYLAVMDAIKNRINAYNKYWG